MEHKRKDHPKEKLELHPRNKHRERYNFKALSKSCPELIPFIKLTDHGDESIDFFNPDAVKMLNKALLMHTYGVTNWEIPEDYLCPPIPGRADYIHHIAELLQGKFPVGEMPDLPADSQGTTVKCLDIGVGASCIYPIIGNREYGWSFVGADIDPVAIAAANDIIEANAFLEGKVELRFQKNSADIFKGIIQPGEWFDLTICNPPFHASQAEAEAGTLRKLKNLKKKKVDNPVLNFGGQQHELWCEGGEERFVRNMAFQSKEFADSCGWFSTLISKHTTLKSIYNALGKVEATQIKTLPMGQGNKISRVVAWTFKPAEPAETE